ncbi:hypothetical protein SLA2020_465640 [Shorea laevis]
MALQLWETLKEAITAYTGLSPATFFTVLALLWAIYYVVTGLFASSSATPQRSRDFEEMEPHPPPVQLGEVTEEELKQYDGLDPKKPLLRAIKGQIYDASQSRMFYGPGRPYALFAGKDSSRALAKMSFEEKDLTGDISGRDSFELEAKIQHENSTTYVDGIRVSYATNNSDADEKEGTMENHEDNGPGSCEEDGQENNDELWRRAEDFIATVHKGWRAERSRTVSYAF